MDGSGGLNDNRVQLRYSVTLQYDVRGPAGFLLNVHAARTTRQAVVEEAFSLTPERPYSVEEDPSGNRICSFDAPPGVLVARYTALVEIAHRLVDPAKVIAEAPSALPVRTLRYLYPSRFCQADLVSQQAWDRFGHLPRGYAQIRAVRDWVRETIGFQAGVSCSTTSAIDTLGHGAGVCRDFAHTMIAFCRALSYPARFVTGVDYGAEPSLGPPDFHAYVEVFIGGEWYIFDPTGLSPEIGLIRIGTGRDAADVSFATIFGPVATGMPLVEFHAVDDPLNGVVLPSRTDLAVSTATM